MLEDGKVVFDMRQASYTLSVEHDRCTLHLWSEERNLVRRVLSVAPRTGSLRLATQRLGQPQSKLLELVASREQRTPTTRESVRQRYVPVLERVLQRSFPDWKPAGFRSAMDLERSFGPAYARGTLRRGSAAWAVIGANEQESAVTIDGILTLGILWLHHCREQAGGRLLYQGLKVVVPRGTAMLTLSRLAWLNREAAQWELHELDSASEELTPRDAEDHGNLRTRLVHHPDEPAARERFAGAVEQVIALVPATEAGRVDQRLRNTAELAFLLHGLEFARARIGLAPGSFAHTLEITVGVGAHETKLTPDNREQLAAMVAELFDRRNPIVPKTGGSGRSRESTSRRFDLQPSASRGLPGQGVSSSQWGPGRGLSTGQLPIPGLVVPESGGSGYGSTEFERPQARRIGRASSVPAHSRMSLRSKRSTGDVNPQQDPLYRTAPERWLESVLRRDLRPLTRNLAPSLARPEPRAITQRDGDDDADNIGNRADSQATRDVEPGTARAGEPGRVIPRLDPEHVYAQVPAIAGASDRGLLDLLGVTADGRLAVIELKADDDLHFALQGLDYWIRVRHHHLQTADPATGLGEFQRHGYFQGVELSPLPPRLYLVAPALHIHPATETLLRYISPRVEWHLLALDERWRQQIKVVWRKQSGL